MRRFLGICYGMQLLAKDLRGQVSPSDKREYGHAKLKVLSGETELFNELPFELDVWMSHGDHVTHLPEGFHQTATTGEVVTAIENKREKIYAVQFHPEVSHTPLGKEVLRNFLFNICGCKGDWTSKQFIAEEIEKIRSIVGENDNVVCGLSGGVDSTVAAVLMQEAIGDRQTCIFVNNGLLRADEFEETLQIYKDNLHLNVIGVDASEDFYEVLKDVVDPELKRKAIGAKFIDVFDAEADKIGDVKWLVQGTLYPDVIESVQLARLKRNDKIASQRRRFAGKNESQIDRTAARTFQRRSALDRQRFGNSRRNFATTSVSRSRTRRENFGRHHARKSRTYCKKPTKSLSKNCTISISTKKSGKPSPFFCRSNQSA